MGLFGESENLVTFPCLRALLMVFNIVFWISGLSLVGIGIWLKTDFLNFLQISTEYSKSVPYILIAIGTIILFVTSLACSCIVKYERSLLTIYAGFLITMIFTLIFLSIYIYAYKNQVIDGISNGIRKEIVIEHTSNRSSIEWIQKKLHCCGEDSYLDWQILKPVLPKSCCKNSEYIPVCNSMMSKELHEVGCANKLKTMIELNLTSIGVAISAITIFPLSAAVVSFAITSMSRKMSYEPII